MPTYKTYNKLYFKGKPTGRAFLYDNSMKAKTKKAAQTKQNRINARWNKVAGGKHYRIKTAKVVKK